MPFPILAAGSLLGAGAAYLGQRSANKQNVKLVREQMAFQERMSGTAYQRAMKDMRLAGLNPMLAFQQGGASTPGGASTQVQSALGAGVSSAVSSSRIAAELRGINAATGKTMAETANLVKTGLILDLEVGRSEAIQPAMDVVGRGIGAMTDAVSSRNMQIVRYELKRAGVAVGKLSDAVIERIRRGLLVSRREFPGSIGPNTTPRRR